MSPKPLNPCLARWRETRNAGGTSLRPEPRGWVKPARACRAQGPPGHPACLAGPANTRERGPCGQAKKKARPWRVARAKGAAGPFYCSDSSSYVGTSRSTVAAGAAECSAFAARRGIVWHRMATSGRNPGADGTGREGRRKRWAGRGLGRKSKAWRHLPSGLGQQRAMRFELTTFTLAT